MGMLIRSLAAAQAPALDKLKQIPPAFWLKVGIGIAAVILGVYLLRKVAGMNKVVLAVIVFVVATFVGFNWIYQRNEPAWATPVVEKLAGFFPSKGSYDAKQARKP